MKEREAAVGMQLSDLPSATKSFVTGDLCPSLGFRFLV